MVYQFIESSCLEIFSYFFFQGNMFHINNINNISISRALNFMIMCIRLSIIFIWKILKILKKKFPLKNRKKNNCKGPAEKNKPVSFLCAFMMSHGCLVLWKLMRSAYLWHFAYERRNVRDKTRFFVWPYLLLYYIYYIFIILLLFKLLFITYYNTYYLSLTTILIICHILLYRLFYYLSHFITSYVPTIPSLLSLPQFL